MQSPCLQPLPPSTSAPLLPLQPHHVPFRCEFLFCGSPSSLCTLFVLWSFRNIIQNFLRLITTVLFITRHLIGLIMGDIGIKDYTTAVENGLCPFLKKLKIKLPWKKGKVLVAQFCLTLWDPTDSNPPGSSVHRILQARIVEWVVIPFSRGSFWSRDRTWTWVFHIAGFTIWASRIKLPDPAISLLVIQPKGLGAVLKRYLYIHIHSSIIHNS